MFKEIYFITTLILCIKYSFSQIIEVRSKEDNKPISFAYIIIHSIPDKKEFVFVTDTTGKANISKLDKNLHYIINISSMGYKKITDTLRITENKIYYLLPDNILNEVVVTAQFAPNNPEKSVHKIKIIDSKKIEAMGAVNLRDVLTNELNIRLSQDNILGSSMNIQGISGQRIKILIDGVPVIGRLNGNIDISQLNLNNVERIEIVEGPLSVNYGTDALGGTINIITKKSQKESFSFMINNYYESNGQYNFSAKTGFKKLNHLISITGGRNYFDGWRYDEPPFYIEKTRIADSLRYKIWKPKEQYFATLNYAYNFKKLKFGYTSDYFDEVIINKGKPRPPYYETAFDDYYYTRRINNSLNLNGYLSQNYYLNILAAHNYYRRIKNTYYKDLTTLNESLTENAGDQDTTKINHLMSRGSISKVDISKKINYEIGYDFNFEKFNGKKVKNSKQEIGDYAVFGSLEYKPFSSLIVRPGIRAMYNTAYKAPLIPSLNLKYSFPLKDSVNQSLSIRLSFAKGFRSPSINELYFYFVDINHYIIGNPNLKAESSNNISMNVSYSKTFENKVLKIDFGGFYNDINNMISLAQSMGTQYSYFNIDKFKSLGVQLESNFSIKQLKINIGGTYTGRYNQISNNYKVEQFLFSPEVRCNLLYQFSKQQITLAMFYKYTGKLPLFTIDNENQVRKINIQDYSIADISIAKDFFSKKAKITIGSKNLFNVKNITGISSGSAHSSGSNTLLLGMGRTYFIKLDIYLSTKN